MSDPISDILNFVDNIRNTVINIGNAVAGIVDFFQNIWKAIVGAFLGLGEYIRRAFETLANGLINMFKWFADLGSWIYKAFSDFGKWLWDALSSIPQAVYGFGEWLYNGLVWIAKQVKTAFENFLNWLFENLVNLWNTAVDMINEFINTINQWFAGFIANMRRKLRMMITADIIISMTWKSLESTITNFNKPIDIFKPFIAVPLSAMVGHILSSVIDSLTPQITGQVYELIPSVSIGKIHYKPIIIPDISEPTRPEKPRITNIGYGLPLTIENTVMEVGVQVLLGESASLYEYLIDEPVVDLYVGYAGIPEQNIFDEPVVETTVETGTVSGVA